MAEVKKARWFLVLFLFLLHKGSKQLCSEHFREEHLVRLSGEEEAEDRSHVRPLRLAACGLVSASPMWLPELGGTKVGTWGSPSV